MNMTSERVFLSITSYYLSVLPLYYLFQIFDFEVIVVIEYIVCTHGPSLWPEQPPLRA